MQKQMERGNYQQLCTEDASKDSCSEKRNMISEKRLRGKNKW